jgi:hypothetical protein
MSSHASSYRGASGGPPAPASDESELTTRPLSLPRGYREYYGGEPLEPGVRGTMEGAFGADFSSVRVHEDAQAGRLGAAAFARGEDLHFAPGQYQPSSEGGRRVLGHELTHVVQQRRAGAPSLQGKDAPIAADRGLEREADELGARAAAGQSVEVRGVGAGVQRLGPKEAQRLQPELEPLLQNRGLQPDEVLALKGELPRLLADAPSAEAARHALNGHVLGRLFDAVVAGNGDRVKLADRLALQAVSLALVQRTFQDPVGDGDLKHRVGLKQGAFASHLPPPEVQQAIFAGRPLVAQQLGCLRVILSTFEQAGAGDVELRGAVMEKIGAMGGVADLTSVMPHVRRAGTESDMRAGMNAIRNVRDRVGFGEQQAGAAAAPEIAELLNRNAPLNEAERTRAIKAILEHGRVTEATARPGANKNEVWTLTFEETLPGSNGARERVRGIYKPERPHGQEKAAFSREVAAFEFDNQFAGTGMVPVTVERQLPYGGAAVGSIQHFVPDARPLSGDTCLDYDPRHRELRDTKGFKQQKAKIRTLLYVLGDPDKFRNNVIATRNLANVLVDERQRLWMIDNGYSLGAPGGEMNESVLKGKDPLSSIPNLREVNPEQVVQSMRELISPEDTRALRERLQKLPTLSHEGEDK